MCRFPKDPTGGLFDFNKDGKLDAAEYTMMNDVFYHDGDEDSDDSEDSEESDFDDTDNTDDEEDADEEDEDSF